MFRGSAAGEDCDVMPFGTGPE